jgi:hypothetical protein
MLKLGVPPETALEGAVDRWYPVLAEVTIGLLRRERDEDVVVLGQLRTCRGRRCRADRIDRHQIGDELSPVHSPVSV